jgi:hypothetical protein
MVFKVIVAPLSTTTAELTIYDIIRLKVPLSLIFGGFLASISTLLNLDLFANIDEGPASTGMYLLSFVAMLLALIPILLELLFVTVFGKARLSIKSPSSLPRR